MALPVSQNPKTKQYTITGIFCSWSCAKAYNFCSGLGGNASNRASLMLSIRLKVFGDKSLINMAPPRSALKVFGGFMTIDEFRRTSNRANVIAHHPPFLVLPCEYHIHEPEPADCDDYEVDGYQTHDPALDLRDDASEASVDSCASNSCASNSSRSRPAGARRPPTGGVAPMPINDGERPARKRPGTMNILTALQSMSKRP